MADFSSSLYPDIDYNKSIKKQRLIYKISISVVFDLVFSYFINILYLAIASIFVFTRFESPNNRNLYVSIIAGFGGLLIICWIISGIFLRDTFVKIKGTDAQLNKKNINTILDAFYEELDFQIDEEKMIRDFKPVGSPIWGRVITVLFDEDSIYLNIAKLGKSYFPTFIHGLTNYLRARKIAKYFKSQIQ